MRVASIIANNIFIAQSQIAQAAAFADIIELRLDYWAQPLDMAVVAKLRSSISLPVMFTLRKASHGGQQEMDKQQRLSSIKELAKLAPDYMDLEWDTPIDLVTALRNAYPNIKLIGSYHNFTETPTDLKQLFRQIYQPVYHLIKIATMANSIGDTLRLLLFLQEHSQQYPMIGMAMGEYGQVSRILAPVVGSYFSYGSIDAVSVAAPGQLTLADLTSIYRIHLLNRQTSVYALLGDPVAHSRGHLYHNAAFAQMQQNSVYVKLLAPSQQLEQAMPLLRQLPFAVLVSLCH